MRFFFHLHNDIETRDEEGRDLPNADAALALARNEARLMAAESVRTGHLDLSHNIEVTDESGATCFRVSFGDVLAIANRQEKSQL